MGLFVPRGASTHVLARGEFLEVSHCGLNLVLMVADRRRRRRRRAGGDAPERRISRRWRHAGRRHGQWAPSCEINVQMVRYPDCCQTGADDETAAGGHSQASRFADLDRVKRAKRNLADRQPRTSRRVTRVVHVERARGIGPSNAPTPTPPLVRSRASPSKRPASPRRDRI